MDPEIVGLDEQEFDESPHAQFHLQSVTTAPQLADRTRSDHSTTAEAEASHPLPDDIQEQLDAQWRDIDRIIDLAGNLRRDVDQMKGLLSDLTAEVRASRRDPAASSSGQKIEQLSKELASVGAKASEVDVLRTELETMKQRIRSFEAAQGPPTSMVPNTTYTFIKPRQDSGATRGAGQNIPANRSHKSGGQSQELKRGTQKLRPKNAIKPSQEGPVSKAVQSGQEPSHTSTASRTTQARADTHAPHNRPTLEVLISSNPPSTNAPSKKRKRQPPSHLSEYVDWASIEKAELEHLPPKEDTELPRQKQKHPDVPRRQKNERPEHAGADQHEAARKQRRADIAAREQEAQQLMEREERMQTSHT